MRYPSLSRYLTTLRNRSLKPSRRRLRSTMSLFPASSGQEPFRAWKLAFICKLARNIMFRAITRHAYYSASRQQFTCGCPDAEFPPLRVPHDKPLVSADCSCGWYAMKNKADCLQTYNTRMAGSPDEMNAWLLEVDLWGTVIEGERGYRGEYQRVLSVQPAGQPEVAVSQEKQLYLLGCSILYRPILPSLMQRPLKPMLPVADLASKLGTEVRWTSASATVP
jgi:hypothetical protein